MHMRRVRAAKKLKKVQKKTPSTRMSDDGYYFAYRTKIVDKPSVPSITFDVCETEFPGLTIPQLINSNEIRKKIGLKLAVSNSSAKNFRGDLNAKRFLSHPTRLEAEKIIHLGTSIPFSILSEIKKIQGFQIPIKAKTTECRRCAYLQKKIEIICKGFSHKKITSVSNSAMAAMQEKVSICVPKLIRNNDKRKKEGLEICKPNMTYRKSQMKKIGCIKCKYLETKLDILQKGWSYCQMLSLTRETQRQLRMRT